MAESLRVPLPRPVAQPSSATPVHRVILTTICLLFVTVWLDMPVALAARDAEVSKKAAELEQVRARIKKLQAELKDVRGTRDAQQAALEKTDKAISVLTAALRDTRRRVKSAEDQLSGLEKKQQAERRKLDEMRGLLRQEIRASYMAGQQQRVKLLLNQEEPVKIARMLAYQGYITRARTARMQEFDAVLTRLATATQAVVEQRSTLEQLLDEQQAQTDSLTTEQASQRKLLAAIDRKLGDKAGELKTLQQNEQRLGKLVEKLRRALLDVPIGELDKPLKSLKGKLGWPVPGRVARNYGEKLGVGNARSRGLLIATRADTDVRAIAKGRVAFADWLRGFGLLMIIEHGDGYMSLYGRNNSLYKGVGEWVERGEPIAAAGNSGGQQRTALYLELRKNGRPLDPRGWFRGKPGKLAAAR